MQLNNVTQPLGSPTETAHLVFVLSEIEFSDQTGYFDHTGIPACKATAEPTTSFDGAEPIDALHELPSFLDALLSLLGFLCQLLAE
jgi:hypothetical protein